MVDVPPFSIDEPRYDQSTYYGRWRQFVELVSPRALFLTQQEIDAATKTLQDYRQGRIKPGDYTDEELWNVRRVYESAVHPQTGETTPVGFRLAAFVPVNIPICAGMLLTSPTLFNTIFWQWVNQSYNAGFNYANRNASSEQDNSDILKSYATASFVSCATAVGLGKLVENAKSLSPGMRNALRKTVPFVAVASAGAFNAVSMRFNEFQEGIDIIDDDGEVRGRSVAAGRQSLGQVALTRVALPMPILLLPPYIFEGLNKARLMPRGKYPRLMTELAVVTLCLWGALPAAVALFPQKGSISADQVEDVFKHLQDREGKRIERFTYNKAFQTSLGGKSELDKLTMEKWVNVVNFDDSGAFIEPELDICEHSQHQTSLNDPLITSACLNGSNSASSQSISTPSSTILSNSRGIAKTPSFEGFLGIPCAFIAQNAINNRTETTLLLDISHLAIQMDAILECVLEQLQDRQRVVRCLKLAEMQSSTASLETTLVVLQRQALHTTTANLRQLLLRMERCLDSANNMKFLLAQCIEHNHQSVNDMKVVTSTMGESSALLHMIQTRRALIQVETQLLERLSSYHDSSTLCPFIPLEIPRLPPPLTTTESAQDSTRPGCWPPTSSSTTESPVRCDRRLSSSTTNSVSCSASSSVTLSEIETTSQPPHFRERSSHITIRDSQPQWQSPNQHGESHDVGLRDEGQDHSHDSCSHSQQSQHTQQHSSEHIHSQPAY